MKSNNIPRADRLRRRIENLERKLHEFESRPYGGGSFKDVLKRPEPTRSHVRTMLGSFASVMSEEMIETGNQVIDMMQIGNLPGGTVEIAPEGTPLPQDRLNQTQPVTLFQEDGQRSAAEAFDQDQIAKNSKPGYKSREKLIEISIDDFLALAHDGKSVDKAAGVRGVRAAGDAFSSLPYLNVSKGRVTGHEGRHRAMALKAEGYTTMPVVLVSSDIRWSEQDSPSKFDYVKEWPTELRAQAGARNDKFSIPFPVSREDAMTPYAEDQTDTPAFKKWFGDSKVVDADGKPLVVYHGTDAEKSFDIFHTGQHFGSQVSANQRVSFRGGKSDSRVYPVYLSIKNPIRLSDRAAVDEASLLNAIIRGEVPGASVSVARKDGAYEAAKQAGYDGIVYRNLIEDAGNDSYVAFDPTQIKSATANQGTFDSNDPSILKQKQEQDGNFKGWTKFIGATRAIIGATDKADFSTFIHELFHPTRRFLLDRSVPLEKRQEITDKDIQDLEDYAGVKDGTWTRAAEEKAARAWEQYWLEGKSPTEALRVLFEKIARWMRQVYNGVQQITGNELTPEVRALFDKIVQRGFPQGVQLPPPHDAAGAPGVDSLSHPERLKRILPNRHEFTAMGKGVMNYMRELVGIPGMETVTKETVAEWVQQAEMTLAYDPSAAERLFREVSDNRGRPLEQHEVTLLAFHQRKLANDANIAFEESVEAAKSGDPERIAAARTSFITTRQPLTEFEGIAHSSASSMGRAFYALQVMMRTDYTLAGLMRRAQHANNGNPLVKAQEEEIATLAAKIAEIQKKLDEATARADRAEADSQSVKQHDKVIKSTPRKPREADKSKSTADSLWNSFKELTGLTTLWQAENCRQ